MGYQGPFSAADAAGKEPSGQSPWPSVIGSVVGAGIDAWSASQANKANARNVDKQIAFQKQQSETEWQRGVVDMQKAGLNPGLAYEKGGNATQTGAAARAEPIMQNTGQRIASAVQTYNEMAGGIAQRRLINAQTDNTNEQRAMTETQRNILGPELMSATDLDYRGLYGQYRKAKLRGDTYSSTKTPETWAATIANMGAGTAQANAAAREAASRTTLNEQQFFPAWYTKMLAPYANATAHMAEVGGSLVNLVNPMKKMFAGKETPEAPPIRARNNKK